MDWNFAESNWMQFKGKVKARWTNLTDDHLDAIAGKRAVLSGKIQEAYDLTKDEAEHQIRRFESRNRRYHPKTAA